MSKTCSTFLALAGLGATAALAPAAAADFSGTQVGLHADYLWATVSPTGFTGASDTPLSKFSTDNAEAGVSLGHDWQSGSFVYGLFGSASLTGSQARVSQTLTVPELEGVTIEHHGFSTDLSYIAALGVKLGFVVDDSILLYGQVSGITNDLKITETGDNAGASMGGSQWGFAAGLGADYRITDIWTVGVSWTHDEFGSTNFTPAAYGPGRVGLTGDAVSLGLKFHL